MRLPGRGIVICMAAIFLAVANLGAEAPATSGRQAKAAKPVPLRPQSLPGLTWEAPQAIQADAKGRVFVLRGDDLAIYPLRSDGELGEPRRPRVPAALRKPFVRAVLSPSGQWLLYYGV